MIGDDDPPGVRAAWSAGAVTDRRGGAGSGWRRGRRGPVSGVVLVVAVLLLARAACRPAWGGAVSVGVFAWSAVCFSVPIPGYMHVLHLFKYYPSVRWFT